MKRSLRAAIVVVTSLTAVGIVAAPGSAAPEKHRMDKDEARRIAFPILQRELERHGNSGSAHGLSERSVQIDELDMGHVRVQQTFRHIPVWGGEAIAHLRSDGSLSSISDAFVSSVKYAGSASPAVSRDQAIEAAARDAGLSSGQYTVSKADNWIVREPASDVLAWRIRLVHTENTATPSIPVAFVDAQLGHVVSRYDDLETDTGHSAYSGTVTLSSTLSGSTYLLRDGTRGNQQSSNLNRGTSGAGSVFTSVDQDWGDGTKSPSTSGAGGETAGVDAAWAAAKTWDYFKLVHGRNGIWNNGAGAPSRVHYGTNYVNAFWDGTQMTYGDGSGNVNPLTSVDVGGHEMSHGVTENTAGLVYSGEAGGLNEATSDIFGTAVEFYANNPLDVGDYLIGEMINVNGDGTPLRYMDKPSLDGGSKDCWYSGIGTADVHYSSGPANHFFYLLSEGSGAKSINGVSYNSPTCNGTTVTGITRAKAEKIWYRALTTYFTSNTNYAGARTGSLNAAADLYGGTASAEYLATCAAWTAVSVGASCAGTPPPGGTTVLQNGVPVSNLSGAAGSAAYFTLAVPSGATGLSFKTSGGTGDVDMYVKFGSSPTLSTYDCRPYAGGNAETCTFATPQAGTYYVMLSGYAAYSGVTLLGSYTAGGGGGSGTLQNGVPQSNLSATAGQQLKYTMAVPTGAQNLTFKISGGTGDADLYVKFGSAPSTTTYDCRPYASGNAETCTFATPQVGTWYVMLNAYSNFSGVSLVGSYTTGSSSTTLQNNVPVNNLSASGGSAVNYTMTVPSGATNLSFAISGGTGDADLYVRFGSAPTTTAYDCRPYLSGNSETCSFATPQVGTYFVMVRAYSTFSGVTLLGKYTP